MFFFHIDSYWHGLCSVDDLMWLCSPWVVDEWFYFLLLCLIPYSSKKTKWGAGARTSWTSRRHGDGPSASKVPSSGVCLAQGRLRPSALLLRNRIVFESNTMTMSPCPVNVPKWQNSLQMSSVISTREISLSRFDSEMQLQAQGWHCRKIWHSTRKRKWKGHKKCTFSKSTAMKLHISVTTVISPHPS